MNSKENELFRNTKVKAMREKEIFAKMRKEFLDKIEAIKDGEKEPEKK